METDARERWRRIEDLFNRASECAPGERTQRLEEWCAGDRDLSEEVASLLAAAAEAERHAPPPPAGADPWVGRTIGPFRLDRLIGGGGMGAVYFGRRIVGDFDQEIAFKLASVRLTFPWLRQRFLEERQMLASLSHPNIARVLDGGLTEEGEPYLVMEYIQGESLDRYCDRTGASVAQILRLTLQLCDAVSFAHRHLIIHRDLKPANVLVTADGRVKLLDFGAAKLLHPDFHNRSEATRMGVRAFTPHYASPEQLLGETVSAASDVYSLGVILYRLLTGRLPFRFERLSDAEAVKTVLEMVPASPHDSVPPHAKERRAALRGDLDAIVLKALRANPSDRYTSVDKLAADIRRHLERRPVEARGGSMSYRAAKLLRRHALGFGASLAIAAVFAAGVVATVHEGRVAASEERRAREGFRNVRRLANLLLFDFYNQVKQLRGSTAVQRQLVGQALTYLDGLARGAAADPDVQLDLVEAYTKMGNVLGNPYEENLGDAPKALASLNKALALAEALQQLRPGDPAITRRLDLARRSLSDVYFSTGNTARAIESCRAAAQSLEDLATWPGAALADVQEAAATFDSLGDLYGLHGSASIGDLGAALAGYRRSLALHERALAIAPDNVRSQRGIAILEMKIANVLSDTQPTAAARGYAEALAALDRLPAAAREAMPTPRVAAIIRHKLGSLYGAIGRPGDAIPYLISARELFASLATRDADDTRSRFDLATVDYDLGQAREAVADRTGAREDYGQAIRILDDLLVRDGSNLVWLGHRAEALCRRGQIDRALGRPEEGGSAVHEALSVAVGIAGRADASAADLDRAASYLLTVEPATWRQPPNALEFAARAVEKSRAANPGFLLTLARTQMACRKAADARETLAKALALLPAPAPGQPTTELRRAVMDSLAIVGSP